MSAEIICVGTELLLGDILNSNARWLAQELAGLGIPHFYQTVVGDNIERLQKVLAMASQRSSILIFTGGLGPTPDDLTTEAIALYFQTPLKEREEIVSDIKAKFAKRERKMTANNLKQALLPEGAEILPNPNGTAPGMIWQPQENLTILTFPGVPSEMRRMWEETAIPYLKNQGWGREIIFSQMLKFRGIGESALAEKVKAFFDLTNPTVAPYASNGEVRLRVSAKAKDQIEALAIISPVASQIKYLAGLDYFGCDEDTLASVVGDLLRQAGQTLSVAESCTGGGLGAMITGSGGASDYFMGGIMAYSNEVKISQLGVAQESISEFGAVSKEVACSMALGIKEKLKTDWALSITGIAGPSGGSEEKPVGLVYIGIAMPNNAVEGVKFLFGEEKQREFIRYLSSCSALDLLRRKLLVGV